LQLKRVQVSGLIRKALLQPPDTPVCAQGVEAEFPPSSPSRLSSNRTG